MGSNWGIRVFADHTRKNNKRKEMHPRSSRVHGSLNACLSSRSDRSRCRWHMHLTNNGYFDYGKNPNTPNLSPMLGWKWRRFWDLPCISVGGTEVFTAPHAQKSVLPSHACTHFVYISLGSGESMTQHNTMGRRWFLIHNLIIIGPMLLPLCPKFQF